MIREDYFPVCCGALNILETLLIHLRLKDPLPLMCPCCGTENAEKETSLGGRSCPELMGFLALLNVDPSSPNQHRLQFQWPIEAALSQVFVRSMLLLEAIWKHKFHQDSSMNLLHFREALYDTRIEIMNSLARSKEFDTYKKTYTGRASSVRSTASIGSSIP
jgi:hypothetical protein